MQWLPLWHSAQLAVDATIVSPVGRTGEPRAGADARPALALDQAAQRKRRHTYPELERARRCHLVVFRCRGRGPLVARGSAVRPPTCARTRSSCTCGPARGAWVQRWSGILSVAAQRAFATSLLKLPLHGNAKAAALSSNCIRSLRILRAGRTLGRIGLTTRLFPLGRNLKGCKFPTVVVMVVMTHHTTCTIVKQQRLHACRVSYMLARPLKAGACNVVASSHFQ